MNNMVKDEYSKELELLIDSKNDIDRQIYKLKKEFAKQLLKIGQKVKYKDTECTFTGEVYNDIRNKYHYMDGLEYDNHTIYFELKFPMKKGYGVVYKKIGDFEVIK